jgi:hypothetical protein
MLRQVCALSGVGGSRSAASVAAAMVAMESELRSAVWSRSNDSDAVSAA